MVGKPTISQNEIDIIFRKLEPYIKTGLSLNKACLVANVPKSTVYDLYNENADFAERIDTAKNYLSVITSDIFFSEIERIRNDQNKHKQIDRDDLRLVQWFALNHKINREEFGDIAIKTNDNVNMQMQEQVDNLRNLMTRLSGGNR
ncbi:hypothetical protein KBC75_01845 [Candidatus Shapirobacteria bacterium]|nr:hypothetical protein [Candidatus Shapirobacteria bacterium]